MMNALEYFKAILEANVTPVDVKHLLKERPEEICLVDVRNGPAELLKEKIPGALVIGQAELARRLGELPKDKEIIVYCWETWCRLAAKAAVVLLEHGFRAKEMYGGIAAWKTLRFPTEPL
jgi:rhodanese-related sulfurtransferase